MLPVIVVGGFVVGMIALLIGSGSKGGGASTAPVSPPAPAPVVKCVKMLPTPSSDLLPSEFAKKYSGSASKWKELLSSNPEMHLVYKHQVLDLSGVWQDCMIPCADIVSADGTGVQPQRDLEWGLAPWKDGQAVTLPPSWGC